jgi:hypothetical protein
MFNCLSIPIQIINFKGLDKLKKIFLEVNNNFIRLNQGILAPMNKINSIVFKQKLICKVKFL